MEARTALSTSSSDATDPGRAWRSLLVIVVVLVAAQPLSIVAAIHYLERWGSQGNPHNQWRRYLADPPADILYVGDSRVREDIDGAAITRSLAGDAGRTARVSSIGIDAAKPSFTRAIAERVVHSTPHRPRTIVIAVSEYQLNETWDGLAESGGSQTQYFWQVGSPFDLSYARVAVEQDRDPERLLAGWMVPLLANYSVLVNGLRCDVTALRAPPDCVDEYQDRLRVMDAVSLERWRHVIRDQYLGDFRPSSFQIESLERCVSDLQAAGVDVYLVVLPVYRVEELDPARYRDFLQVLGSVSLRIGVNLTDLHSMFDSQPEFFADPNHLNARGAEALGPHLAAITKPKGGP